MTIEHTPDGTPYLSDQSYLSETPPYTQELAQIIDAGTGGGVCDIKDSKFNDLQPADPISPFPIGMLAPFMGENAPDGWLLCDGRSYDAAYFYALAEANPDFHNDGTFRVPDLRGRVPLGQNLVDGLYHPDFPDIPNGAANHPVCAIPLGQRWGDWRIQNHWHKTYHTATVPGGGWGLQTITNGIYSDIESNNFWPVRDVEPIGVNGTGVANNLTPYTGVNFIVYSGRPTLDTNGDILPECGQGEPIAAVTTRMMIESRLAEAGITEEEVKMLKDQLEEIKKREAK